MTVRRDSLREKERKREREREREKRMRYTEHRQFRLVLCTIRSRGKLGIKWNEQLDGRFTRDRRLCDMIFIYIEVN